MPYVSMFFGIIIRMFHNEHNPPHFHAEYQGQRGVFSIDGTIIKGNITSKTAKKIDSGMGDATSGRDHAKLAKSRTRQTD